MIEDKDRKKRVPVFRLLQTLPYLIPPLPRHRYLAPIAHKQITARLAHQALYKLPVHQMRLMTS